jgi:Rieske Fe-S protein
MSAENVVFRRRLLVLGAAASILPACGSDDPPLGGPYGGTASGLPGPTPGSDGGASASSSGGSGGGSGSSSGGGYTTDAGPCATGTNTYVATFAVNPSLLSVGQGVVLNDVPGHINGVWLIQQSAGKFFALDLTCTHQSCPVGWVTDEFVCPCHGSIFTATGAHVSGPGVNPLAMVAVVCSNADGVVLTP